MNRKLVPYTHQFAETMHQLDGTDEIKSPLPYGFQLLAPQFWHNSIKQDK